MFLEDSQFEELKIGDRILEDMNNPAWGKQIFETRVGIIIGISRVSDRSYPKVHWYDGTVSVTNWEYLTNLPHIFNLGDRVTPVSKVMGFGRFRIVGTVRDIQYDNRKKITWLYILWDDGVSDRHVAGAEALKIVKEKLPLERKNQCDTLTSSAELVALHSPQRVSEEYTPSNLLKLIQMPKPSCDRTGEISQSTQILVTTHQDAESLTSIPLDSHVQEPARQEQEQDLITKTQPYGLKPLDVFARGNQASLLLKTLKDLSIEDFEQCLEDCEWQDIAGTVRNSYRQNGLAHRINETGYLSLPTPNASSKANSRAAGQTKCEIWFRNKGLLQDSQCLSPQIMALLLGFPKDWTRCLWESKDVLGEESVVDTSSVEQLSQLVQPLHLEESSISIPSSKKLPIAQTPGLTPNDLYDRLAKLEVERNQIKTSGVIAQQGVWIECGKVSNRKFRQAYYRSSKPIFPAKRRSSLANSELGLVKRSYIGEENSKEVKAAGEAIARRNRLEVIAKEIKQIEEKLCE
jgi:hypothetical protein